MRTSSFERSASVARTRVREVSGVHSPHESGFDPTMKICRIHGRPTTLAAAMLLIWGLPARGQGGPVDARSWRPHPGRPRDDPAVPDRVRILDRDQRDARRHPVRRRGRTDPENEADRAHGRTAPGCGVRPHHRARRRLVRHAGCGDAREIPTLRGGSGRPDRLHLSDPSRPLRRHRGQCRRLGVLRGHGGGDRDLPIPGCPRPLDASSRP